MAEEDAQENTNVLKVFVTGFGAFQDVKINPSWEIASQLPSEISWKGLNVEIIAHNEPLEAAYNKLLAVVPPLLDKHKPDITLHIGLAVERDYFAIETGSQKEGYHQYPDIRRKVFTKAETKKFWGKRPDRLDSSLDIENIVARWATNAPKGVDVRLSDDVGNYVCGFVYYTSLEHLDKKDRERPVLFLHVPPLDRLEEIRKGRETVLALIRAVVESQR